MASRPRKTPAGVIRTAFSLKNAAIGNFLGQGYEVGSGRDWARLGNRTQAGRLGGIRLVHVTLPNGVTRTARDLEAARSRADARAVAAVPSGQTSIAFPYGAGVSC